MRDGTVLGYFRTYYAWGGTNYIHRVDLPQWEDVGPSFAEPQSGSAGELSPVPIEIQGFLKIFHPNPKSVTYGALINNPNTFAVHFHGDVGDFL